MEGQGFFFDLSQRVAAIINERVKDGQSLEVKRLRKIMCINNNNRSMITFLSRVLSDFEAKGFLKNGESRSPIRYTKIRDIVVIPRKESQPVLPSPDRNKPRAFASSR